jgi:tetratricopeptide (TPR) repeat protein
VDPQQRAHLRSWAVHLAWCGVAGAFWGMWYGPVAGAAVGAGSAGLSYWWNPWHHVRRAIALVDQGRFDEAERLLAKAERRGLAEREPVVVRTRALIAWYRGRLDEAERWLETGMLLLDELPAQHEERFAILFIRATFLAMQGQVAAARATRALAEQAPDVATWAPFRRWVALALAFGADSGDELPPTDELLIWTGAVLADPDGSTLMLLAWALDKRGREEPARRLVMEAVHRYDLAGLGRYSPRLRAWIDGRAKAWALDAATPYR